MPQGRRPAASSKSGVAESTDAKAQLESFLLKFTLEVSTAARAILREMRRRYPTSIELVYDNYNALAVGFASTERASDGIFSIALYPKWVSLFFLQGVGLPDPKKILKGSGNVVRHVVLESPDMLHDADLEALMQTAVERARVPFPEKGKHRIIIKSVSRKQRPRQPASATTR